MDVENIIKDEIESRKEQERDMLAGTVDMEETILEAIRNRYQKEWDLVKEDIEKKKEALNEELNLIDERLKRRKDAANEAKKYEELAELKEQYANIVLDSTRTKDAAKLREQIRKLEEEIGWDIADKQAEMEKQSIQDQLDAYDKFIQTGDENLEKMLEDANNFAAEVTQVLGLSYDELMSWLQTNDETYLLSLENSQAQML
jgi:RNA processing factor Prp31